MAYLRAQVTRCMLSYSIAMSGAISTVIMNMASLMSTTTKEFTENTGGIVRAGAQQQQQPQAITKVEEEELGTNDIQ
jgi:hypothetical protein